MRALTPLLLSAVAFALAGCATASLHQVPRDATVSLPVDHGPHAWAQTEWWHLHADVHDVETGEPLHLFAGFVVQRTALDRVAGLPVAPVSDPYHLAYVQLVSDDGARGSARYGWPALKRPRFVGDALDLRHAEQRIAWDGGSVTLEARVGDQRVALRAEATRPATLLQDGRPIELVPDTRHLWYQDEGMRVSGRWTDGKRVRWVEGTGFFKHQWGRIYDDDVTGFTWISGDLPDGRALVVVRIHRTRAAPKLLAWTTLGGGRPDPLDVDAIELSSIGRWLSPRTGKRWDSAWALRGEGLDLTVRALFDEQELAVFPAPMHVGPARATGTIDGQQVDLIVFMEQVGGERDHPLRFLFRSKPPPEPPSAPPIRPAASQRTAAAR